MQIRDKAALKRLIDAAQGIIPGDTVLKNCHIIDVYNQTIADGDIVLIDGLIAGVGGTYDGAEIIDASGTYAAPGLIDGHIHVESSYLTPEELGRLIVPCGTTTIIADPHEIVNVCGLTGLDYMIEAAKHTALDIRYMVPSCVPATAVDHAGAIISAADIDDALQHKDVLGLAEFMDYPAILSGQEETLAKLMAAHRAQRLIDGHSPGLSGHGLMGYAAAGIHTEHECSTADDARARLALGMYVMLRYGSACHDLPNLLPAVTAANMRHCLLCSDDLHTETIFAKGHLNEHLRLCVQSGLTPLQALTMATLNAAECYHLDDRGALAPGRRADIVLLEDLENFHAVQTWIGGHLVAKDGIYLPAVSRADHHAVGSSVHLKDFSAQRLQLHLKQNKVHTMDIIPGSVVTEKGTATIPLDETGDFIYRPDQDIVKLAVVERHKGTGNVGLGLLRGYGIQRGAVATSIAHDSHNIIVTGTNNADMALAVQTLANQNGGIALALDGRIIATMPLPIAGLMSDQPGTWVDKQLRIIFDTAHKQLGVNPQIDAVMTLCFMSLPVIPKIKLLDSGLFDVESFSFMNLEA
jgi:adenine deaminase